MPESVPPELRDLVSPGLILPDRARLWIRSHRAGILQVSCWPESDASSRMNFEITLDDRAASDFTGVIDLPPSGRPPLQPLRRYAYRVTRSDDGRLVGEGAFETAPANPAQAPPVFSFALMSCNQPFQKDGSLHEDSVDMLRAAQTCLENHDVKMIFMTGDQIYVDWPRSMSLFDPSYFRSVAPGQHTHILDCSAPEIRALYHRKYRVGWGIPEWQRLLATYPCYMIWDDHEIVNNWGSKEEHKQAEWQKLLSGARKAFVDYQGSRTLSGIDPLPANHHFEVSYGPAAFFALDLRYSRDVNEGGGLIDQNQWDALEAFLQRHQATPLLFFILSVPVVHLPQRLIPIMKLLRQSPEDFQDRWSSPLFKRDRARLFETLRNHQLSHNHPKVVFLSGDIHTGCAQRIAWDSGPKMYQFISSPITHQTDRIFKEASKMVLRLNRRLRTRLDKARVRLLENTIEGGANPYGGLNLGIVEVISRGRTQSDTPSPALRFLLYGHRGEEPVCVYRSELL